MINIGDTYTIKHFIAGRPEFATVIRYHEDDYLITMEGKLNCGTNIRFHEHQSLLSKRWNKQLNLFDVDKRGQLSKKYLI